MTDARFAALTHADRAALLADAIEASIANGGDGPSLGPTDAALAAKALRAWAEVEATKKATAR